MNQLTSFLLNSEHHAFGIITLDLSANVTYANMKAKAIYPIVEGNAFPRSTNLYSVIRLCLEQQQGVVGEPLYEPMLDPDGSHFALFAYPMYGNNSMSMLTVILCQSSPLH